MMPEQLQALASNPKAFMSQSFWLNKSIEVKKERIAYWQRFAKGISVALEQDVGMFGSEHNQSRMENTVTSIVVLQREILEEVERLIVIQKIIEEVIEVFLDDPACRLMMEMRYLKYLTLEEIAFRMGWSYRWVQKINKKSLQRLAQAALVRVDSAL